MYGQFFLLVALVLTGFILRRINFTSKELNQGMNKLTVYFAYPCLILQSIANLEIEKRLLNYFFEVLLITLCSLILFWVITHFLFRILFRKTKVSPATELASICPNNGFIGFPVALIFLGQSGLILMVAHNTAMSIFIFSIGTLLVKQGKGKDKNTISLIKSGIIDFIKNPNIIAVTIGFIIYYSNWHLPELINTYLGFFSDIATPLAMLFIGSMLTECNLKEILRNKEVWVSTCFKQLLIPGILAGILILVPLNILIKQILFLGFCMPTAIIVTMIAEQEKVDAFVSVKVVFLTTILSMLTLPLSIEILNTIF